MVHCAKVTNLGYRRSGFYFKDKVAAIAHIQEARISH